VRVLSLFLAFWMVATAQVAPMLNLVVIEGEGAVNNIRQRTAREPIVQVEDENHRPVAGAVVVFMLPTTGASGTFANGAKTLTVITDNQGRAVARGLKPNGVKGDYQIRVNVSHNGQTASTVVSQTNVFLTAAGAPGSPSFFSTKVIVAIAAVGVAAAVGGTYYATHSGSSSTPIAPVNPGTTIATGAGTVGPPR
jgi:hypothetical protein